MDVNKLTKAYVRLRDAKLELKKKFDEEEAKFKAKLELLEAQMLKFLNESKLDSVKTPSGTFYRQEEITHTGSDWQAFYDWIKENDGFEFLERRIKKTAIKEYMDANEGGIPPGVSVYREFSVRVRRG